MFLNLITTTKITQKEKKPQKAKKSAQEAPNMAKLKTKRYDCTSSHKGRSQKVFKPEPNPKYSPKRPKNAKNPNFAELKMK